jgi:heptosyltransferase II
LPHNILVVRLSSLGDVILTSPVYRALKAHWPGCRVAVLVKPAFADALRGNPSVDEVIPFEGLGPALAKIKAGGFTHLLDLHANLRSFLIRRLAGIPEVSVYRKDALARRVFVAFGLPSPALERHTVERYLDALRPWGVTGARSEVSVNDLGGSPSGPAASRVLLIQTAFLGDTLLTLPLAARIKRALPDCRLTVLTLEGMAELFRKSPDVDEVRIDRKRGEDGGLAGTWRLSRRLKEGRYDLALIPHRSLRSALLAYWAGVPRRVGFSTSAGRFLLTDAVPFSWMMHDLERNLTLLKPIAAEVRVASDDALYVSIEPGEAEALAERLSAEGVRASERLIGVHPGSAWPTKRWLPERFAELCRRFSSQEKARCILVGGPADAALCAEIARGCGALDWSGKTNLTELKALMGRLSLFVTNDSGPMHLAAACGVPVLAVFGPTTRELGFFPYGGRHTVLEHDLECRPCGLHGAKTCPAGHFLCMKLTTVDAAWDAARRMLAAQGAAS